MCLSYGIYDVVANEGFVNVGASHDTADFAVDSIRRWWSEMGQPRYPHAHSLMITADSGGSNGSRNRLWKTSLQKFADESGLNICVCHFPPGTMITARATKTGLKIKAGKSDQQYVCGTKILMKICRSSTSLRHLQNPSWSPLEAGHHEGFCK